MEWDQYKLLSSEEREEYNYKFGDTSHESICLKISKFMFCVSILFLILFSVQLNAHVIDGDTLNTMSEHDHNVLKNLATYSINCLVITIMFLIFSLAEICLVWSYYENKENKWLDTKFERTEIVRKKPKKVYTKVKEPRKYIKKK